MLYGFTDVRNEFGRTGKLSYTLYDNDGNDVTTLALAAAESATMQMPKGTTTLFFDAFESGELSRMKSYCTESCATDFFDDDYCFGMKKACIRDIWAVDQSLYSYRHEFKDSAVFLITADMIPHEDSIFLPTDTTAMFYIILEKQSNGRYLIDEFATGL